MQLESSSYRIDSDKLFSLLEPFGASYPNPDDPPHKPGPWDPLIRQALKNLGGGRFGPHPDPWRSSGLEGLFAIIAHRFPQIWEVLGGSGIADRVALNPQPLPPRYRLMFALGEALAERAEMLGEMGRALARGSQGESERGIIVVGGYVDELVDDWCGTIIRPRWPFPGPKPNWFPTEFNGRDTLTLAAAIHQASGQMSDQSVSRALEGAAEKLANAGLEQMG